MSSPRRLKLLLEYNGSRYHGWQIQPQTVTIQGTLEACVSRITNAPVRVHAAGRTDAGVHALTALVRGLNGLLPDDIVVRQAEEVSPDFHARHSALRKTYAYIVHNTAIPSAFRAPYTWHISQPLDLQAMRTAAATLRGEHDFSAFRAASCSARTPQRHLYRLHLRRQAERLLFVLCANGFLQHMARNIVGTLVMVGRGQLAASAMAAILQSRQRQRAGPTAPAQGLFLVQVVYDSTGYTPCASPLASGV